MWEELKESIGEIKHFFTVIIHFAQPHTLVLVSTRSDFAQLNHQFIYFSIMLVLR